MFYKSIYEFKANIEQGKRILGIDLGQKKTGLAISDSMFIVASPLKVMMNQNLSKDLGVINKCVEDENIGGIVVGLPLELSGEEGEQCKFTRNFAEKLYKKTNLPIYLQDERFSTVAVTRTLRDVKMKRKNKHMIDDKLSAGYILQIVLDQI